MRELIKRYVFQVQANDFDNAGAASSTIKRNLKTIAINPSIVRKVAVASYEAEINIIIHSNGGEMVLEIYEDMISIKANDKGPGIQDVDLAMSEGFSTASNAARELGFGAGMGLPNIKKYSDNFKITSNEKGTRLTIDIMIE